MALIQTKIATAASIALRVLSYFFLRWVRVLLVLNQMFGIRALTFKP